MAFGMSLGTKNGDVWFVTASKTERLARKAARREWPGCTINSIIRLDD